MYLRNANLLYSSEGGLQKDRLVSILFHDHEGNLFEGITGEDIKELKSMQNSQEFLLKLLDKFKHVYKIDDEKIKNLQQIIQTDLNKAITELLKLRFEKEFELLQKDSYEITGTEEKDLFREKTNMLILEEVSDDQVYRLIFYPVPVKREGYTKLYEIGNIEIYPFVLVKQKDNTFEIASRSYRRIKNTIKEIEKSGDVQLKKIVDTVKTFNISPSEILHKLRESGGYIKKIRVNDYHYTIKLIARGDTYIPVDYFNLERFLMNPEDILKLKELYIEYFGSNDNPTQAIPVVLYVNQSTIKTEINDQEVSKRVFELKPVFKKKDLSPGQKEAIYKLFEDLGISLDHSYEAPISYYFNRMIFDYNNFKSYYNLIKNLYPDDNIVEILENEKILDSEGINLDKLGDFLENAIRQAINSMIMIKINDQNKTEEFKILSAHYFKDSKEIQLKTKRTWDNENGKSYEFYISIIIPLKRHRNTQKQRRKRLTHVVLEDISIYGILNDLINKNYRQFYESVYYKALAYLIYYHGETLEKESSMAFFSLKKNLEKLRQENLSPTEKRSLGNKIEDEVNILLKYIYGNYIPYGGKGRPDGVLVLVKWDSNGMNQYVYLIDSKQHSSIRKPELRKMREYLENFAEQEGLPKTEKGAFIISRAALTTDSLNPKARKELLKGTDMKFGFITVEFIMELFRIYREHRYLIESMDLRNKLKDAFIEVFNKSVDIEKLSKLIDLEEQVVEKIKDELKVVRQQYYPQRKNMEL